MSAAFEWPAPRLIAANGVRLALHAAGPAAGLPVLFCHGFPEIAFSWRHQLTALARAGYRVLAPDQRGYGRSEAPAEVEAYGIEELCADLVGVLDAEGIERAVICGHDWGGFLAWDMARRHPERVLGVISLNTPHLPRAPADPIAILRARYGEAMYIVFFQTPGAAEALFEADVARTLRYFYRLPELTPAEFAALPPARRTLALQEGLARYDAAADTRQFLTPEEFAVFVEAFERSGFRGPVNWYRNMSGNWARSAGLSELIPHPALMILAENDVVLPPALAEGMEARAPHLTKRLIRGSGHWTQQEQPEAVNAALLDWLGRSALSSS